MAQYKVPQDVEADDKLLGPFTFRQFIYLIVAAGMIALAFALWQIFPLLAIIPVPVILFFAVLALPLKKDQPMETYLAAIVSFYLKPNKRFWDSGQRESTIEITAPKKVEQPRARDITQEEAGHRLSFLANIIDSEGQSIRDANNAISEDLRAEASAAEDILDTTSSPNLSQMVNRAQNERHTELVNEMRTAINSATSENAAPPTIQGHAPVETSTPSPSTPAPVTTTPPTTTASEEAFSRPQSSTPSTKPPAELTPPQSTPAEPTPPEPKSELTAAAFVNLANNDDYTVETIQKEAERIKKKNKDKEVFISLR